MKLITITAFLALAATSHPAEKVAATATSGRFKITQEFHEDPGEQGEFLETVRFADTLLSPVRLSGMSWPGHYDISPDENWLLRTQKTGAGASMAMLYRIEANGRVSEVMGFDDLLWKVFDTTSPHKKKDLYHNHVSKAAWTDDSTTVKFVLKGTEASAPGDDIVCHLTYDLNTNRALPKPASSKPDTKSPP
jgi:hypothetical protein